MSKTVYVVAHSHWDREWYFTLEDSNVLLSKNMKYLLNVLEKQDNYASYTFDGQISVIDEYLKTYPEDLSRIKNLVKNKRLFVGPWYTQCDTLTIQTESVIRNLLFGIKGAMALGHSMQVGYLPDIFGQNQYLPSIFKKFGIQYCVFQRGVKDQQIKDGLTMKWISPDKQNVLANHILLGYGPGKFLNDNAEYVEKTLTPILNKLANYEKSEHILLPAGGDQVLVREHFTDVVQSLNKKQKEYHFKLSNYEEFMQQCNQQNYSTIEGELIECQNSRIHRSIKSQRYDIKQLNYLVENKLLYRLEPLLVIAKRLNVEVSDYWYRYVWKQLFDVQAHDSIAGCNSDDTNAQIMHRLHHCDRIIDDVLNVIKKEITDGIVKGLNKDNVIVLFNTNVKESTYDDMLTIFTYVDSFSVCDLDGKQIPYTLYQQEEIDGGKKIVVSSTGDKEIKLPNYYKSTIVLDDYNVPSLGYSTLEVIEEKQKQLLLVHDEKNEIENNDYILQIDNHQLILKNKKTNVLCSDFIVFEESSDHGDSYDYCPGLKPTKQLSSKIISSNCSHSEKIQNLQCVFEVLMVDGSLLHVDTHFVMRKNTIDVTHHVINQTKNHRLRVLVQLQNEVLSTFSDQGFSVIKRNNKDKDAEHWKQLHFVEQPLALHALENFVVSHDQEWMNTIIVKGIKEYEVVDNKIALTLYRSVGVLGKDDLTTRPGRASGINNTTVYTEDAQLLKPLYFDYQISCHASIDDIYAQLEKNRPYSFAYQHQKIDVLHERLDRFDLPKAKRALPHELSLMSFVQKGVFVSTIKLAYDNDSIIIRLFNPNNYDIQLENIDKERMVVCDLKEESIDAQYCISAKGYITLKIKEKDYEI